MFCKWLKWLRFGKKVGQSLHVVTLIKAESATNIINFFNNFFWVTHHKFDHFVITKKIIIQAPDNNKDNWVWYCQTAIGKLITLTVITIGSLHHIKKITFWSTLWIATTSEQRPIFVGPESGRCAQVWLYMIFTILVQKKTF